ncbi:hypothetical protein [Emticicia sp. 17c]
MEKNITPLAPALKNESSVTIRNVLKLIGMKEVATNVFSLPTKNK